MKMRLTQTNTVPYTNPHAHSPIHKCAHTKPERYMIQTFVGGIKDVGPFPLRQGSPKINLFLSGQIFQSGARKHFLLNECVSVKHFVNWKGFCWKISVQLWYILTCDPDTKLSASMVGCKQTQIRRLQTGAVLINATETSVCFPHMLYQFN